MQSSLQSQNLLFFQKKSPKLSNGGMKTLLWPQYSVFFFVAENKYSWYSTSIFFKNLNSQYFAIFLDNSFQKNFVKRNRLTKQYYLRLGNIY